jgi:hypothetical protein
VRNDSSIRDSAIDLAPGAEADVTVVLTKNAATLRGVVLDESGARSDNAWVVVFPADSRRWTWSSRSVYAAMPDDDGEFVLEGLLPSADYLIAVARGDEIEHGQWREPATLQVLRARARSLALAARETKTVNLQVPVR